MGSDGIAISADEGRLYYNPLAGRHLYSVPTDFLADRLAGGDADAVVDEGDKGGGGDGMESDAAGYIYT